MRCKKTIVFPFLILCFQSIAFSSYISEINFEGSEYIELYWNETLPQSITIYDEAGKEINNTAILFKEKINLTTLLIIGNSFLDFYNENIDTLNCTIYLTDKSQVSNGGLKSHGERFELYFNNKSLKYNGIKQYNFETNNSLHYSQEYNYYTESNKSPCLIEEFNLSSEALQLSNLTNNFCDYQFEIKTEKEIFKEKLEFIFLTSAQNYTIEYWIEDYENKIVKEKRNTTNSNKKSYTPKDQTQIYNIKSKMYVNNCTLTSQKLISFYSKEEIEENNNTKPHIKILNEEQVQNGNRELKIELYRGNSNKRIVHLYHNSDKLNSFDLEKYSKLSTKIMLNPKLEKNTILLEGLGLEQSFDFFIKDQKDEKEQSKIEEIKQIKEKQYLEIQLLNITQEEIQFNLSTNIEDNEIICYIINKRTKISNIINISIIKEGTFYLEINQSILEEKTKKKDNLDLKLLCKYKPKEIKSYYSESIDFNLTTNKIETVDTFVDINQTISSLSTNSSTLNSFLDEPLIKQNTYKVELEEESQDQGKKEYTSRGQELKQKSFYFIFIGVVIIFIGMLFSW